MERLKTPGKPSAGPRPPRQRRAFSLMGGPIETEGDPARAAELAALFEVDPALARALTHGFHSYAGRLHPSMARGAILRFSSAGARVLDPFCGSGTVLVEAMAHGRKAVGLDASPLAVLIASVRTTTLGTAGRERLVAQASGIAESSAERARKRQRPVIPGWAKQETRRFEPHVALELLGLRELVMAVPEDDVGRALRMCFSSLLVKFSRGEETEAQAQGEEERAPRRLARGLPSGFLARRAQELARGLAALEKQTPEGTEAPRITLGDARACHHLRPRSFDLVVSSPPYAGTYDYARQHEIRFLWLGLSARPLDERQVGTRTVGLGASPQAWRESRRRWLGEMGRLLTPGGQVILVVGDGVVGDRPEDAARAIAAAAEAAGLEPVARASQQRPILDRRVREIFGGPQRREHVLLLRRRSERR